MLHRRFSGIFVLALFAVVWAVGCGGDMSSDVNNPNPINNPNPVTSDTVSFSQNVQPIFNASCASAGCHGGAQPAAGLDLRGAVSFSSLVNQPASASCSAQVAGAVLVKPGDTEGSMLWRKLANDPGKCGAPMPLGTNGLINVSRSSFDTIEKWIQQGALNN